MALGSLRTLALGSLLALSGCGGSGDDGPSPPVLVSLGVQAPLTFREAANRTVRVSVGLNSTRHAGLTVPLQFTGSATLGYDYAASADSIVVPPNALGASVSLDIYRDFEAEGDETITITIGAIEGNARPGASSSATLTILDGEAAVVDKTPGESTEAVLIAPIRYVISETSVEFGVIVIVLPLPDAMPGQLIAEWSSDADFATDLNTLGVIDIAPFDPDAMTFVQPHFFRLPLSRLASNQSYFIRAYVSDATGAGPKDENALRYSFATNAQGQVVTRCEAPAGMAGPGGEDPLFAQQWHLRNTGQTGFSRNRGIAGEDLHMNAAIENGRSGQGVAPGVALIGFNPGASMDVDFEGKLLRSLGASSSSPDSAGVDIFNMSFGNENPSENTPEDFASLYRMGVTDLRFRPGCFVCQSGGQRVRSLRVAASAEPRDRLHRQ